MSGPALSALGSAQNVLFWVASQCQRLAAAGITWRPDQVDALPLESLEDLQICNHNTIDNDGNLTFSHSTFFFITKGHTVYWGSSRMKKLTLEIVNENLKPVPDAYVFPKAPSQITRVTKIDSGCFVKGPALTYYDELGGSEMIARLLLQEAEMLEYIERNPHPNILRYRGCQVHRGRIISLVLQRYPRTLEECMCKGGGNIDLKLGFDRLKSGVMHLHSLGLAHNDIKASNIMVGEDDTWILADIGSCRPFGDRLIIAGNPQWETSSRQHDEDALHELWMWLIDCKPVKV